MMFVDVERWKAYSLRYVNGIVISGQQNHERAF